MGSPVHRKTARRSSLRESVAKIGKALEAMPPDRQAAFEDHLADLVEQEESTSPPTVSQTLLAEIRRRDLTAYSAAKLAKLDTAVMARFLSGERTLSQGSIDKLAAALGLSLQPIRDPEGHR